MTSSQTIPIDTIKATDGIWQICSEYDAMLIAVYKEALKASPCRRSRASRWARVVLGGWPTPAARPQRVRED
jgi:hypothetical protein